MSLFVIHVGPCSKTGGNRKLGMVIGRHTETPQAIGFPHAIATTFTIEGIPRFVHRRRESRLQAMAE